jgi:hydroxymethylpyrimidine pyrophosphatase-like HAD family hydrolase
VSDFALVATDLDGTLIDPQGRISDFTRETLRAVEESGRLLVFVTGRPPRWMAPIVEETGHRGIAICANGAVVMDLHTEHIDVAHVMDEHEALEITRRIRALLPTVGFAVERVGVNRRADVEFGREPHYIPRWPTPDKPPLAPIDELVIGGGLIKILARVPQEFEPPSDPHALGPDPTRGFDASPLVDEFLASAQEVLADLATVTHSNPNDTLLEISAPGITKATALADFAAERGISADQVIAFGDQPNDLPMLAWAGRAIAVENAHPAVLGAVAERAGSVHADGVAHALRAILSL